MSNMSGWIVEKCIWNDVQDIYGALSWLQTLVLRNVSASCSFSVALVYTDFMWREDSDSWASIILHWGKLKLHRSEEDQPDWVLWGAEVMARFSFSIQIQIFFNSTAKSTVVKCEMCLNTTSLQEMYLNNTLPSRFSIQWAVYKHFISGLKQTFT